MESGPQFTVASPLEDATYGCTEEKINSEDNVLQHLLEIAGTGELYMDIDDVKKAYDNVDGYLIIRYHRNDHTNR